MRFIQPRVRQPRAACKDGVLFRLQQSADEPDQLLVALVVVGRYGMRRLRTPGRGGRVEAGAAARLQISHRNQAIICLGRCETADIVGLGKVADGRQSGARSEMPFIDLSRDAGDDLVGEALVAILADDEGEHAVSPAPELARSLDQYSYAE
jgi:hypothetical protein